MNVNALDGIADGVGYSRTERGGKRDDVVACSTADENIGCCRCDADDREC